MGNVKLFRSTDFGANATPLYGNAGYLIPVLEACLVNGYGEQGVSTLTHSAGTVTVTTTAEHGLTSYSRQTIAGAVESGYNGEFIITVINVAQFTYQASGITIDTATGTITTKTAGAGWTKAFSGTNLAAYRTGAGIRDYLRVSDSSATATRVIGYENMTAISTGTGPFPTTTQMSGGFYWRKNNISSTETQPWIIIADDTTMYLWIQAGPDDTYSYRAGLYSFGEYISKKGGDLYRSYIIGALGEAYNNEYFSDLTTLDALTSTSNQGFYSPRSYRQIGASVPLAKLGDYSLAPGTYMGANGLMYPDLIDGSLYLNKVRIVELQGVADNNVLRGEFKGVYIYAHYGILPHESTFEGTGTLAGKTFMAISCMGTAAVNNHSCLIDISLTW